jgi:flagellin
MSLFINTNIASLYAQNNVANSQSALATSIQRLSSGLRINSAKDDAAGMAIAARMTSQIGGMTQAAQNANDGISLSQTAEGALQQVTNDLQTMRNLAVQAANGTNSAGDRASLQASISQLQNDISQIATNTQYNGLNLLDGSLANVQFQIGANAGQVINASVGNASANAIGDNSATSATGATGTMMNTATTSATTGIAANSFSAQTLTISVSGQTMTTSNIASGTSAFAIAQQVNSLASTNGAPLQAVAHTYATLQNFTAGGSVSLTLQGAPTAAGAANPVTISATMTSKTDTAGLAAAINAVSSKTGISAVADTVNGKVSLIQNSGYDIGVTNTTGSAMSLDVIGATSAGGTLGTAVTLAATSTSSTVGGTVDFHSSGSFAITSTAATFLLNATSGTSGLQAVNSVDVTKITNGIPTGANNALFIVDNAINTINGLRADLGALQNRFQNAQSSLNTTSTNMQQARSRIQDTDFAAETANLTHNQILQQAGTAMLAQANALPNSVLTLLK